MGKSIFGWDLPPGVRVSDIPGNRPEDVEWDKIVEGFWNKDGRNEGEQKALNDAPTVIINLIDEAIEYGVDIGLKQLKAIEEENKYYYSEYKTPFREKLREDDKPRNCEGSWHHVKNELGTKV